MITDPSVLTAVLGLHSKEWVERHSEEVQRVQISKIHLPTGFSWKKLKTKALNDAAVIELKNDVQFSPKVKIRENVDMSAFQVLPICLPSVGKGSNYYKVWFPSYAYAPFFKGGGPESLVGKMATITGWGKVRS